MAKGGRAGFKSGSVEKEEYKKSFDKRDKKYPSLDSLRKSKPQDPLDTPKITVSKSPEFKAKGGRAGYKSGGRGCKLAMKGKGRAYGKNS